MIANKILTIEDFALFQERMQDMGLFEFIDRQIIPVQGTEPVDAEMVAYVLSPDFDQNTLDLSFPMPTQQHDRIVSNLHFYLRLLARGLNYFIYSQATDIFVDSTGKIYKPDIVLVQKDAEHRENHRILNPLVLFEVLSKSTQAKDQSEKLEAYQSIPTLQVYVLIAQDEPKVMVYQRLSENTWQLQNLKKLEDRFTLQSIELSLSLQEIYEEVDF
ncbi:MAG: Uma2 family endonuclease [Microscillaceae bacterium]|nr:Uma2 family endonuclease [Microscillaceae bacterium]